MQPRGPYQPELSRRTDANGLMTIRVVSREPSSPAAITPAAQRVCLEVNPARIFHQ
jgi:hypothetical protein